MTYTGRTGQNSGVFRRDIDPLVMSPDGDTTATFVAPGTVTRGEFGLYRWDMPAGATGAGAHFHRGFSESFYIVSGTVALFDGAAWTAAHEGDFLYVPPGGIHGFANNSDSPASMLILFTPGIAREEYFQELSEIRRNGTTPTQQEWTDLLARHDQVNL